MTDFLALLPLFGIFVVAPLALLAGAYLRQRARARVAEREMQRIADEARAAREAGLAALAQLERERAALSGAQRRLLQEEAARGARPTEADTPEGFGPLMRELNELLPLDRYGFFLGWRRLATGVEGLASSLHGESPLEVNHRLISAASRWGKDLLVAAMRYPILRRTTPQQFVIATIDGKGPDAALLAGLAHNWCEPATIEDAPAFFQALRLERQRREKLIVAAGVTRWEELPEPGRPPLLEVYVGEMRLIQAGLDGEDAEEWLAVELSAAAGAGIRYVIAVVSANNTNTGWRDQCSMKIAGYLGNERQVEPALGLTIREIEKRGGLNPCDFQLKGTWTIRDHAQVASVRAPYLSLQERKAFLAQLPRAGVPLSPSDRLAILQGRTAERQAEELLRAALEQPAPPPAAEEALAPIIPFPRRELRREEFASLSDADFGRLVELVPVWEEQVRAWARVPMSRNQMLVALRERRGAIGNELGKALFRAVLGPGRPEPAEPGSPAQLHEVLA